MAEPVPDTGGGVDGGLLQNVRVISPADDFFFIYYIMSGHVYANYYNTWHGWSGYSLQEDIPGIAIQIDVATDGNGKIVISWIEVSGEIDAYMKVFDLADWSGWGPTGEVHLDFNDANPFADVEPVSGVPVAIGSDGVVTAVWSQNSGARYGIYSNRIEGGILQGVQTVDSGLDGNALSPDVSMDASNNAVCVWQHDVSGELSIFAAKWEAGSGPDWGASALIESRSQDAYRPRIDMNRAGNALVVWTQAKDSGYLAVYANVYDATFATGFDPNAPQLVSSDTDWLIDVTVSPEVRMDVEGNAQVVWGQSEWGWRSQLIERSYSKEGGWSWSSWNFVENYNNGEVRRIALAAHWGEAGRYAVVWEYDNPLDTTYRQIMASEKRGWSGFFLDSPADGSTTDIPVIGVNGHVYPGSTVSVNGINAYTDQDGAFSLRIPLLEGSNAILVVVWTSTGVGYATVRYVTYNNPIPQILADIAQLFTDMGTISGEVDVLQTDVATLQTDVGALQADVAELEANVTVLQADVAALQSAVDTLQADVAAAESQLTDMQGDLAAIEDDIADMQNELDALTSDVGASEDAIAALQDELASTQAQADALHDMIETQWTDLNATKADLAAAEQDIAAAEDDIAVAQADISDLPSQMFVLIGLIVVALVLAVLLALMYFSLKKKIAEIGK